MPMRPSFVVSPRLVMPTTSEQRTTGTIIILMRLMKIVPIGAIHQLMNGSAGSPAIRPTMTASTSAMKILIDKFMKITPWVLRTSRMRDQSLAAIYFRICMIDNANSLLQFFIIEKRAGDVHWYGISIRYTYIVRGQCGAVFCIIVNRIRFLDTISLRIILLIIRKTALPCMIPVSSAQKKCGETIVKALLL